MTYEEWDVWTRGSAIRRAGYAGFRRNVAVAIVDWLAALDEPREDAVVVLRAAVEDESDLVREHAAWALDLYDEQESNRSCHAKRRGSAPVAPPTHQDWSANFTTAADR